MRSLSHLVRMPWIVVWVAAGALSAAAQQTQQTDDLQKQLEQLKQRYDATTRDLEKRIAALEQQIVKQKEANEKTQQGTISVAQLAAQFWAGERYYRRQHIEIDDFYPLDMSGYGTGVEDLNVGVGKLAVAFLSGARPDIITQNSNLAKSNIDVRLYDLKGPAGLWAGWFNYATSKGGTTATGAIPTANGYAFGLRRQRLEWHGGYHSFSVQYGTGAASNYSTSIDNPKPFLHSSARLLATEQVLFQPNDRFAIMPIFIYQRTKRRCSAARLGPVGFIRRAARNLFHEIYLVGLRGRVRSHAQSERAA